MIAPHSIHLLVAAHEEVVRHVRVPGEALEVYSGRVRVPSKKKKDKKKDRQGGVHEWEEARGAGGVVSRRVFRWESVLWNSTAAADSPTTGVHHLQPGVRTAGEATP